MMHPPQAQITTADNEMLITRTFDAPPELVWRAWTDPKQIVRWWGPIGFTTTSHAMDVRVGGHWRFDMHFPDGRTSPNRIVFEEVVPNQRLVYAHTGDDDVADITFRVIVNFDRTDAGTKLTMRMIFPSADELQRVARKYGAVQGGIQTIGRLADHLAQRPALTLTLPSEREIIMSRTFDAPRARVWDTMTNPDLLRRWLFGPPGWTMTHCENNAVPGGTFRYAWRGPDNVEMAMKGIHSPPPRAHRPHRNLRVRLRIAVRRTARHPHPHRARGPHNHEPHPPLPLQRSPRRHHRLGHGARRRRRLPPR